MEQQGAQGTVGVMSGEEECLLCRVTYSIFSTFPLMPSAMALNVETGEFFPHDRLRSYSTGYDMADALGFSWACRCRKRPRTRFDERFTLYDREGHSLANVRYRIITDSGQVFTGTTNAMGQTRRVATQRSSRLQLQLERQ